MHQGSYSIYLLHMPVIALVSPLILIFNLPMVLQYVVLVLTTFVCCWLLHVKVIEKSAILLFLFNGKFLSSHDIPALKKYSLATLSFIQGVRRYSSAPVFQSVGFVREPTLLNPKQTFVREKVKSKKPKSFRQAQTLQKRPQAFQTLDSDFKSKGKRYKKKSIQSTVVSQALIIKKS